MPSVLGAVRVRRRRVFRVSHLFMDVGSGGEGAVARAREYHRLDAGVRFHVAYGGVNLTVQPLAQRVQHFRPVQADDAYALFFRYDDVFVVHGKSLGVSVYQLVGVSVGQ